MFHSCFFSQPLHPPRTKLNWKQTLTCSGLHKYSTLAENTCTLHHTDCQRGRVRSDSYLLPYKPHAWNTCETKNHKLDYKPVLNSWLTHSFLFYCYYYVFWLHWVSGTVCGLRTGMRDLSSPTRDWTRAPCIGSMESYPLVSPHGQYILPLTHEH